ncbi:MAG: flagellar hook-length control protein FliK [Proteobacteria bacterium]|nr:flagellar hook-length control protein FliK [Pseudomonadota bacterium]
MAIGPLPPVISEIQANSGQPGKTLAQQTAASSLLDLQAAAISEPAIAILPETTLLEKAVAEALGHQGGLAPLYATLAELADAPDLPDAVKAAVDTILAFRLDEDNVTPARVAEAIRSSGVFHEAVAAGKMAAALPPAVRQALGDVATADGQAAARPVTLPSTPMMPTATATQVSALPANASPPPTAPTPASAAAQAYGRQGGSPPITTAPVVPPRSDNAPGPTITPNTSVGIASAAGPVAPPATLAAPQSTSTALPPTSVATVPVPTSAAGEAPPMIATTAIASEAPLPPAVGNVPQGAAAAQIQTVSGGQQAQPAPSINQGAEPAPLPSPVFQGVPATPTAVGQHAEPLVPASNPAPPSPASAALPTADPSDARVSTRPSLTVPTAQASAASRSFAPWTPGRPFTPTAPAPSSPAPAGSSGDVGRPASPSPAAPAGGEIVSPRAAGDRAPFVPSAVENLPNAPPEPVVIRVPAGPGAPSHAQNAPTLPGAGQPSAASVFSSEPASVPVLGQRASPSQSEPAPQSRPAAPAGGEISAAPPRPLAQQISQPTVTMPLMAGVDLKGALEVLRRELITWLGRNADVMASLDGASGDTVAPRIERPPPPRKSSPVRGQPAVLLPDGDESETTSTETLAGRALGEAERSLSRVFLHQAATAENRDMKAAQPTQALMLEIPIVGPNGTSVAQLRIERDDHAPNEPGAPPRRVFQVDIAFDIAPLGPVAVRVGLMDGRRVAVGVWCESDDGLVRMEAERENIVLGLEQEGMVVAGVDLHRGHPAEGHDETAVAPSHRLDLQL